MDQIPAAMDKHLDAIQAHKGGGILLGASNLTGRYWLGSLWYYENPDSAPDVEKCTAGVQLEAGVADVAWADSNKVLVGLDTGGLAVWELVDNFHTFTQLHSTVEHDDYITSVSLQYGHHRAVSSSCDKCIKVWDLEVMYSTATYKLHYDSVWSVKTHHTEADIFLSCSQDGRVVLWDTRKPKPASILDISPLSAFPTSIAWQPDTSTSFAVGDELGNVVFMDTRSTERATMTATPHSRMVYRMEFSQQRPNLLATISEDCTAVVTSFGGKEPEQIYCSEAHTDFVHGVTWSTCETLYTCGWDSRLLAHSVNNININKQTSSSPTRMDVNGEDMVIPTDIENNAVTESEEPPKVTYSDKVKETLVGAS